MDNSFRKISSTIQALQLLERFDFSIVYKS